MLKIIPAPENINPIYTIRTEISDENPKYRFPRGIWLEYWEDPIINFRFFYFNKMISVLPGILIDSSYTKTEIGNLINALGISLESLEEWLETIPIEILEILPENSEKITKIWKYDYKIDFYRGNNLVPVLSDNKYAKVKLDNTKIIHSLPYLCGSGFKYYSEDIKEYNDKNYWFNLCHLKYLTALK